MTELAVLEAPDTADLEKEGNEIVGRAEAFIVKDAQTYGAAGEMVLAFKRVVKQIKGKLDPVVTKAHETHRALTTLRNETTGPYMKAEVALKDKMGTWKCEDDARVRREQEAAERERQAAAAKQAREAEELRQANMPEAAEKMIAETPPPPARVFRSEVPAVKGISASKTWKHRVTDPGAVTREYLIINEPLIRDIVKRTGKQAESMVGGIEVYEDVIMAGRTG